MKKGMGKSIVKWLLTAIFAAVMLTVLGWLVSVVAEANFVLAGILATLLIAALLITAMKVNPGKEDALEVVITILIVSAVLGVVAMIWTESPLAFVVDWSLQGLALAASAVIFASAITGKVAKNI